VALYHTGGGQSKPKPSVISCTTGAADYDEWNSREILRDWTDHPQRLWDVIEHTLASGVELVIHGGPEPRLIPTAFERLSGKIMKQLKRRHLDRLGRRVLPSISRNHWLARNLPLNAVLFRAPFVNHLILEDWLLAQDVDSASVRVGSLEEAPLVLGPERPQLFESRAEDFETATARVGDPPSGGIRAPGPPEGGTPTS